MLLGMLDEASNLGLRVLEALEIEAVGAMVTGGA